MEDPNKLLKIEKTCDTCDEFFSTPWMFPGGKCQAKNCKSVDFRETCPEYKLRIKYALSVLADNAFIEVKMYNDIADGMPWEELIKKYDLQNKINNKKYKE